MPGDDYVGRLGLGFGRARRAGAWPSRRPSTKLSPPLGLDGIPVDGGFETVDAATHQVRAADANGFMFGGGPARRFIASPAPGNTVAVSALPGGTSADPSSPFYLNLLRPYLDNEYYPALLASQLNSANVACQTLISP